MVWGSVANTSLTEHQIMQSSVAKTEPATFFPGAQCLSGGAKTPPSFTEAPGLLSSKLWGGRLSMHPDEDTPTDTKESVTEQWTDWCSQPKTNKPWFGLILALITIT